MQTNTVNPSNKRDLFLVQLGGIYFSCKDIRLSHRITPRVHHDTCAKTLFAKYIIVVYKDEQMSENAHVGTASLSITFSV